MVNDGDSILGEVDIKLHVGCTLQEQEQNSFSTSALLFVFFFVQSMNSFSHTHIANLQ